MEFMTLNDCVEQARLHGMSYGQYVATYRAYESGPTKRQKEREEIDRELSGDEGEFTIRDYHGDEVPWWKFARLYYGGKSCEYIARRLGASPQKVQGYVERFNLELTWGIQDRNDPIIFPKYTTRGRESKPVTV